MVEQGGELGTSSGPLLLWQLRIVGAVRKPVQFADPAVVLARQLLSVGDIRTLFQKALPHRRQSLAGSIPYGYEFTNLVGQDSRQVLARQTVGYLQDVLV
ncbi:hypothetical protein [Streptomyces sp. NPDC050848]|uniref:hypothetical protein n=1 Tax=Streptomyces sp. NPDC050848 TaxID=3155791 RepID=UPI0033F882A4